MQWPFLNEEGGRYRMASFENFEPIFGEPKPELAPGTGSGSDLLRRCLFHVYASDSYHLTVHVTDFFSSSWETVLSVSQLDDLRDTVGIGGSWSEFIDYLVASMKSDNVKLVLEGSSGSNGVGSARLVSQKAKGMPRVTISLRKTVDSSAREAMANLSLELFKAFRRIKHLQEGEQSSVVSTEKEKKDDTRNQRDLQLDREKMQKMSSLHKPDIHASLPSIGQDSPAKQAAQDMRSKKAAKRVPAHRRKRGALLLGSEDENED